MRDFDERRLQFVLILILVVMTLFGLWAADRQRHKFLNDDTLITLTYAKNLAAGHGFVFNHPPATLGTTSPLLALAVGGLAGLLPGPTVTDMAVFFTALCWVSIAWLFFFFRRGWGLTAWQAVLVGLVVIATGRVNLLGMEGYLFAALLILSLSLLYTGYHLLSGLVAGLLFLTRGEGALVFFLLLAIALLQAWQLEHRIGVRLLRPVFLLALGFAVPVVLWSAVGYATFGRVIPDTLAAKMAQGQAGLSVTLLDEMRRTWLAEWGATFRLEQAPWLNLWWILVGLGLLAALVTYRRWLVFAVWMVLYIVGYTALGVATYWWYQFPIIFVLQLFAALGLVLTIDLAFRAPRARGLVRSLAIGLVVSVLIIQGTTTWRNVTLGPGDWSRGRALVAVSDWLNEHTTPADSVAYIEVGYLGYHTPNRIVDLMGLVTPEITPHVANRDFAWGFWHFLPDYFLYLPTADWALKSIVDDARFAQQYQAVAQLPGPRAGTEFTIYQRVSTGD